MTKNEWFEQAQLLRWMQDEFKHIREMIEMDQPMAALATVLKVEAMLKEDVRIVKRELESAG